MRHGAFYPFLLARAQIRADLKNKVSFRQAIQAFELGQDLDGEPARACAELADGATAEPREDLAAWLREATPEQWESSAAVTKSPLEPSFTLPAL